MIQAAKILEQRSHIVPGKLKITEHFFQVPRDYSNPSLGTIQLFARSAQKHEVPLSSPSPSSSPSNPNWLLYLQGGPGFECPSPQNSAWVTQVLEKGYQVLCLDQRGTGLSTAISQSSLQLRGDETVQVNYLKSFRADSIVKDCEAVRKALTSPPSSSSSGTSSPTPTEDQGQKWSIMGQSFGGFCITTYLSFYPEGVKEAFVFGGLPPSINGPDRVYERLYKRVQQRNKAYYEKYPEDIDRVKRIVKLLSRFGDETVRVQGGEGFMSARRFLGQGILFGKHGGVDQVHEIVLRADTDLTLFGHLTKPTIMAIEANEGFDSNVIYALLHEPIYVSGPGSASDWSAERLLASNPAFVLEKSLPSADPVLFTGEMIYPFMFDSFAELKKLKIVGETLAQAEDWPALYDWKQLAQNTVPVYAAVYYDDMYVDFDLSVETARKIKGCKTFITNAMYHNAIRSKVDEVIRAVWALKDDVID